MTLFLYLYFFLAQGRIIGLWALLFFQPPDKIKSKAFQEHLLDTFLEGLAEERLKRKLYFKGVQTLEEALAKIRITRSNDATIRSITEKRRGDTWSRRALPIS